MNQQEKALTPALPEGRRARLEYLRDFMTNLPAEKINLNTYEERAPTCGTVGCVAGWASMEFNRLGGRGVYGRGFGYEDVEFFDISQREAQWLFALYNHKDLQRLRAAGWTDKCPRKERHRRAAVLRLEEALRKDAEGTLERFDGHGH